MEGTEHSLQFYIKVSVVRPWKSYHVKHMSEIESSQRGGFHGGHHFNYGEKGTAKRLWKT